jgi:hypothetical protein
MGRRGYPPEFRRKVLDLVEADGRSPRSPRRWGTSAQSISSWPSRPHRPRPLARPEQPRAGGAGGGTPPDRPAGDRVGGHPSCHRAAQGAGPPVRRFAAIQVMATRGLPVQVCCRVLEVSQSGYYAWRSRPPSARAIRHAWLTEGIRQVHAASHQTQGQPGGPRRAHPGPWHQGRLSRRGAAGCAAPACRASPAAPSSGVACDPRPPPPTGSSGSSPVLVPTSCG